MRALDHRQRLVQNLPSKEQKELVTYMYVRDERARCEGMGKAAQGISISSLLHHEENVDHEQQRAQPRAQQRPDRHQSRRKTRRDQPTPLPPS